MASFNHNKKRNSGLVYEFIVRRMGAQLLDEDKAGYARTLEIVKKYYSAETSLAKERELFEVIRNTRGVSEGVARKILGEVARHAKALDRKKIEIKKSNLIKEINHSFGKDFYSAHRVPDYRLLASIQMLIDGYQNGGPIVESVQKIQLEEAIVRFMTTTAPEKGRVSTEEKVDNLVANLAAKKFGELYRGTFNKDQKVLLERYVRATMAGDRVSLGRFLVSERDRLLEKFRVAGIMKEMREDKVMKERMDEAVRKLGSLPVSNGNDEAVEEVILFYKLAEELSSNE